MSNSYKLYLADIIMMDEKRLRWRARTWVALTASLPLVLVLSAYGDDRAAVSTETDSPTVLHATPISQKFQNKFDTAYRTIPGGVWRRLDRAGWQVCLAAFVVDAAPELDGRHPRGWPANTTWNNTDAVHLPKKRLLVFAEKRHNGKGKIVATHRVGQVVRHEVGHAFDAVANAGGGLFSDSSAFRSAYHRDIKQISDADRKALAYFAQPGKSGRQEAFAEAFAIVLGSGSDLENGDRFPAAFKEVTKLVQQTLRKLR